MNLPVVSFRAFRSGRLLGVGLGGALLSVLWMQGAPSSIEVRVSEGTNFAVAVSPDGSKLTLDLQGTLWALPTEGGEAQALTDGLGDDRLPDYSPDGSRLVFQSYRGGSWDIWTIGADGSGLQPMTEGRFDDREPVWSPDGTCIAFSSDRSGNYDIWILDVARAEISRLTSQSANDYMPAWSPDGSEVAFISERGEAGTTELWKIGVRSPAEEKIASFPGRAASPSWSRDGRLMALRLLEERVYEVSGLRFSEGVASDLVVVPVRGGQPVKRIIGEDVFPFRPHWTVGGDLIYTSDGRIRRLPAGETPAQDIPFSIRLQLDRPAYSRRVVRLPEDGEPHPVRGIVRPVLSPDGKQLAFTALGDIWIALSDGSNPVLLTRDEFLDSDPSWSPDGRDIVFSSDRAGSMDLWSKKADAAPGGDAVQLTHLPGAEVTPVWSPDGRWIAFTDQEHHLYVIPAGGGSPRRVRASRRWAGTPSWSSDSRHLALSVLETYSTRFREGINRIAVVEMDSGEERMVELPDDTSGKSLGTRAGDGPAWSPDGRKLAFAMDGGLSILPVTSEGDPTGPPRRVFDAPIDFPGWSPDSRNVVFLAAHKLMRVDVESGTSKEIPMALSYRVPLAAGRMVLRNARVIDGTGAPPRDNMDIFIEGDRILGVQPAGSESADDVRSIDVSGKTVIPGLIDMHAHLTLPDFGSRHGRLWLAFGVTTIRSTGGPIYRMLEERESIDAGRRIGPRILGTGLVMDGARVYYPDYLALETPEELLGELERAFQLDYDLIKTYVRLPDALQKTVVEQAHRKGIFVTSHEVYPAVAFGVDGIEHLGGTSRRGFSPKITDLRRSYRDFVELVARSGAYLTPTLLIQGGFRLARAREPDLLEDARLTALLPPWAMESARRTPVGDVTEREEVMAPLFATLKGLAEAGGRIVAGTDAPIVPYGYGLILEIEQMSEAGLGPLQAIRSATQVAAEALGAQDDLGTIRPGRVADLVILGGDPVADIRNLRRVDGVILGGRLVPTEKLVGDVMEASSASQR